MLLWTRRTVMKLPPAPYIHSDRAACRLADPHSYVYLDAEFVFVADPADVR